MIALDEDSASSCDECNQLCADLVRFDIGDYPYDFDVCADCLKKALELLAKKEAPA